MNAIPDAEQIVDQSLRLARAAEDVATIDSVEGLDRAVRHRQEIGRMVARVREFFEPLKTAAYRTHKEICSKETGVLAPLMKTDVDVANAIRDYKSITDARRREQEREEQARQQLQREADAAAVAADYEAAGDIDTAAAIIDEAIGAPLPVVVIEDATKGIANFRRRWLWRLAPNGDALIPREYLTVDDKKISGYVRAMKSSGKIPGVEIYYVDDPIR